jgi:hypothetical protein
MFVVQRVGSVVSVLCVLSVIVPSTTQILKRLKYVITHKSMVLDIFATNNKSLITQCAAARENIIGQQERLVRNLLDYGWGTAAIMFADTFVRRAVPKLLCSSAQFAIAMRFFLPLAARAKKLHSDVKKI